jgi:hypothetical protein
MRRLRPAALLLVALCLLNSSAAQDTKKAPETDKKDLTRLREAEVKFADGSSLRVLLMIDNFEVLTKYGKLTLPTTDLRRIDFGQHVSDELTKKIEDAIARLGSDTFQKREDAGKELIAFGAPAYPALRTAAKSGDQEIGQRARAAMDHIRDRTPARLLNLKSTDSIQTNEFAMQGRIVNPNFKVRTAYFGDLDVKVADIRSIRWTGTLDEPTELTVDAAKFGAVDNAWMDTQMLVESELQITLTAGGQVDLLQQQQPGNLMSGPEGNKDAQRNGAHAPGTLIGKIGENGEVFVVGQRLEKSFSQEGKLFLRIVAFPNSNGAGGAYTVKVTGARKDAAAE